MEWRNIPNFSNYLISENGTIFSKKSNKNMTLFPDKDGYLGTILTDDSGNRTNVKVHRLVLLSFIGIPQNDNDQACHYPDPDVTNNSINNLRWESNYQNQVDYLTLNIHKNQHGECLSEDIITKIKNDIMSGIKYSDICKRYNIKDESLIYQIKSGKKYSYYGNDISYLHKQRHTRKFSNEQIQEIRASTLSNTDIAKLYKTTPGCISKIRLYHSYKDVI